MNTQLTFFYRVASRSISVGVLATGLVVLLGWVFNIPELTNLFSQANMKANTALGFISCSISLWFINHEQRTERNRGIANVCAIIALMIGGLTLGEYATGNDFGIDQLLIPDVTVVSGMFFPGRMSPVTALNLLLLGSALLLVSQDIVDWLSESLTIVVVIIAGVSLIGYIYGISPLYQIGFYSPIALLTVLNFILLAVGILFARPGYGLINILNMDGWAGILARRLLPAAIGIPVVFGWLFLSGVRAGYYESAFGIALFALSNVVVFSAMIWRNSRVISTVEAARGRAEQALNLSERRAQALIENSWDAIALFSADGSILYGSPSTRRVLGYTLTEFVGRKAFDLVHSEDQALVAERLQMSLHQPGRHISINARVRHKNGEWRWLEGVFTNLLHEPGVQAIVNNYRDFTERKEAEEALRRVNDELEKKIQERTAALLEANRLLQMLMNHMPDHIYFKDAQSRFIRNSRSQAKALGLNDPSEAVGKSDFDFFPHAQDSFEIEQGIIQSGSPLVDQEEFVVWPSGQETWVSTTKVPLRDEQGSIVGTFGISRDITDRKRTELELQRAKLELEAANKELEAFSYSVSHDLRAPLRSVDGFSQAILEDYGDVLPAEGRNFLERIRNSTQRMARLIDDLLNLSRVTRAPLKSSPINLSKIAEEVAAELKQYEPNRDVQFVIAPDLKAMGDPRLLQIVLENLMSNAWKFTSKRDRGEIEVGARDENSETVYFIRDNGAGFDMTYANKLFGAFQRLHAMTEFPGTGVGLATIQRIIHRHGGRVWAIGVVDQGATFFFTLPILAGPKPAIPVSILKEGEEAIHRRAREII